MKVTLIIPAKNEADCIGQVLSDVDPEVIHEVIVVDGHSTDGTPEVVRSLGFRCIPQEGTGYGMGVRTGIKHATGDVITMVDADGSYRLEDIPRLLAVLEEGYDIAYGSRYLPESGSDDDTPVRWFGNKLFTWLLNRLHGVNISDALFLYVAARKEVFEALDLTSSGFEYCIEFPIRAHQMGFTYKEIPSREKARIAGHSKVNALWDGLRILWVLLREKLRPGDKAPRA